MIPVQLHELLLSGKKAFYLSYFTVFCEKGMI